jgi:hypothetical protein
MFDVDEDYKSAFRANNLCIPHNKQQYPPVTMPIQVENNVDAAPAPALPEAAPVPNQPPPPVTPAAPDAAPDATPADAGKKKRKGGKRKETPAPVEPEDAKDALAPLPDGASGFR